MENVPQYACIYLVYQHDKTIDIEIPVWIIDNGVISGVGEYSEGGELFCFGRETSGVSGKFKYLEKCLERSYG